VPSLLAYLSLRLPLSRAIFLDDGLARPLYHLPSRDLSTALLVMVSDLQRMMPLQQNDYRMIRKAGTFHAEMLEPEGEALSVNRERLDVTVS